MIKSPKKGVLHMKKRSDYLLRLLQFVIGQSTAATGASLMIALSWGSDAYNTMVQGLARQFSMPHGTMSSIMQLVILLICIPKGRKRIGLGTVICIVLVGTVVNTMIPIFAPIATAPFPVRIFSMLLVPLMIGCGVAFVQLADVGMSANDLLPLILYEMQNRFQYRVVRILYDASQCIFGFLLGGTVGICTVISLSLIGPIIQAAVARFRKLGFHERIQS